MKEPSISVKQLYTTEPLSYKHIIHLYRGKLKKDSSSGKSFSIWKLGLPVGRITGLQRIPHTLCQCLLAPSRFTSTKAQRGSFYFPSSSSAKDEASYSSRNASMMAPLWTATARLFTSLYT